MYKKIITLLALLISISGLILQFFYDDINRTISTVLFQFNYNVLVIREDILWISGNSWIVLFNVLVFIGGLVFYFSKEKETRILRFAFPVLLISNCYTLIFNFYFIFAPEQQLSVLEIIYSIALIGLRIFIFYFLYKSTIYLNKLKVIDSETLVYTRTTEIIYFKPDNWQRLLHFIIDAVVFGIISFQFLFIFAHTDNLDLFFRSFETQFNRQVLISFLVFFFGTLLYFVFESLFQATPGKFLTESRVTDKNGAKVSASTIFKRSLSRNIPFDPLSFLGKGNWHDSVSNTVVYKEKQTGIKGKYYLLLLPVCAIVLTSMHCWEVKVKKEMDLEYSNKVLREKNEKITASLKTIDTNTVLQLPTNAFNFRNIFLKTEKVTDSIIEFSVLYVEETGDDLYIEKGYENAKGKLRRVKLKRSDLQRMILRDFKQSPHYEEDDKKPFLGISEIPMLKGKYIDDVLELNSPNLKAIFEPNFTDNELLLKLRLHNQGIPAEVVSIIPESKNVKWNVDDFPTDFDDNYIVYLIAEGKGIENYKLKVIVNDSLNKQFIYEISGTKDQHEATVILLK
ncbi:putative RDD family membrane protein YckC [Flavobacterium sp. 2755]|uniref:RDD family protein n=1 Tax=Flavobacterium sp. 2755 TaxID=2817765 RepID=UPI0028664D69|nr:RDD family protein [Flavobacterium sp. 2755]MDR6763080.1 putative RDD family membrane protein YckC [Flavobacterium sp. 2755]